MPYRIGTSGFDYPHWRGVLYPDGLAHARWLEAYATAFDTVELNATFYFLPPARTFRSWAERVPPGFVFAVKASRYLTHVRRLESPRAPVELLMERASLLGEHLGPVLLQLPPDMSVDVDRLDQTLAAFGRTVRVAVEPRHPSWFSDDVCQVLQRHGAALCLVDRRGPKRPAWRSAAWTYVRLHEGRARPRSCYGDAALRTWAGLLRRSAGSTAWVYFNNDGHGCAVRNARRLRVLVAND